MNLKATALVERGTRACGQPVEIDGDGKEKVVFVKTLGV